MSLDRALQPRLKAIHNTMTTTVRTISGMYWPITTHETIVGIAMRTMSAMPIGLNRRPSHDMCSSRDLSWLACHRCSRARLTSPRRRRAISSGDGVQSNSRSSSGELTRSRTYELPDKRCTPSSGSVHNQRTRIPVCDPSRGFHRVQQR